MTVVMMGQMCLDKGKGVSAPLIAFKFLNFKFKFLNFKFLFFSGNH